MKDILLKEATRDELIDELIDRVSVTHMVVNEGEGASISGMFGNIYVQGTYQGQHIFVIPSIISENECEL